MATIFRRYFLEPGAPQDAISRIPVSLIESALRAKRGRTKLRWIGGGTSGLSLIRVARQAYFADFTPRTATRFDPVRFTPAVPQSR